jgi:hypothetical protein
MSRSNPDRRMKSADNIDNVDYTTRLWVC